MLRYAALLAGFVVCLLAFPSSLHAQNCEVVKEAVKQASRLRKLTQRRSVRCKLQDKKQVEEYLRSAIAENIPGEKVKFEEQLYKLLGYIPEDYDYLNGLIELYTSQLGGYYDPKKKFYAMAAWIPAEMQTGIAVHELTHALQDQHFDLEQFIDHRNMTSDELLARSAVVEGDATIVMLDYGRALGGQPSLESEPEVSSEIVQSLIGGLMNAQAEAPPALRQMLVFPYASGLHFAHALRRKGGSRALDKAFRKAPATTEQILHPEKFLRSSDDFSIPAQAVIPSELAEYFAAHAYADTLGEFMISVMLSNEIAPQEASIASSGWAGDRVDLYAAAKEADRYGLVWDTRWDTVRDAEEFLDAVRRMFEERFETKATSTGTGFVFRGASYRLLQIGRQKNQVLVFIAP